MKNMYKKLGIMLAVLNCVAMIQASSSLVRTSRTVAPRVARAVGAQSVGAMGAQYVPAAGQNRSFVTFSSPEWSKYPSAIKIIEQQEQIRSDSAIADNLKRIGEANKTDAIQVQIENLLIAKDKLRLDAMLALSDDLDNEIADSKFTDIQEWQKDIPYNRTGPFGLEFSSKKINEMRSPAMREDKDMRREIDESLIGIQARHHHDIQSLKFLPNNALSRELRFENDKQAYKQAKKLARDIKNKLDAESGRDENGDLIAVD